MHALVCFTLTVSLHQMNFLPFQPNIQPTFARLNIEKLVTAPFLLLKVVIELASLSLSLSLSPSLLLVVDYLLILLRS
jgi:hypothetical protein